MYIDLAMSAFRLGSCADERKLVGVNELVNVVCLLKSGRGAAVAKLILVESWDRFE